MKSTPLLSRHKSLHAKLVEFAGYEMPLVYESNRAEHMAVRESAGLFDVSHMGEICISGPRAMADLMKVFTQDVSKLEDGQASYGMLCNENGGIIDDIIVYRIKEQEYLLCVNAANKQKDLEWIEMHCEALVKDESDQWAQIAIQGPKAIDITAEDLGEEVKDIKRFRFKIINSLIIARTGYTGEDGFEIFCPVNLATDLWDKLSQKAKPCGLSARDTLRLEAGLCLWGQDINEETSPLESNLAWTVKLDRGIKFIGQEALLNQKDKGLHKKLIGLIMESNSIARPGYEICDKSGAKIGFVTSGTKTPFLNQAIAIGYLENNKTHAELPVEIFLKIRNKLEPAKITNLPFYRRA